MIIRNARKHQYTKFETCLARNGPFRPEELGLYITMLSHTDNGDFTIGALARETNATAQELRDILLRLERKGFVRHRTNRFGTVWDLIENPFAENETESETKARTEDKADAPQMTNQEMANQFFALAEKLKRENMQKRIRSEQACRRENNGV